MKEMNGEKPCSHVSAAIKIGLCSCVSCSTSQCEVQQAHAFSLHCRVHAPGFVEHARHCLCVFVATNQPYLFACGNTSGSSLCRVAVVPRLLI
jgi:hypothetical protein